MANSTSVKVHPNVAGAAKKTVRSEAGTEELVPAAVADRMIDGAGPLKVWREHRARSQSALARAGVNRVQIADIEVGCATGSVRTLRSLAEVLHVTVDDLVST